MPQTLCRNLSSKISEQLERAAYLASLLPSDRLDTPPPHHTWSPALLLGHLLDSSAGFCAALYAADPARLAHLAELRALPVNAAIGVEEFQQRIENYSAHIRDAFLLLDDTDLARSIPTAFVPSGETLMTLLLGNLEHFINHKHQLFVYLKAMNVAVGSSDLYRFRA